MFETFLMVILLPASIIFNILLLIRGINLVKQNENVAKNFANYELIIDNNKICKDLMLNPPSDFLNQFGNTNYF